LKSILGEMSTDEFFEKVWQVEPKVVSKGIASKNDNTTAILSKTDPAFNAKAVKEQPLEETIQQGWNVLVDILQRAPLLDRNENDLELPVVMINGDVQRLEDVMERYGTTQILFSAFLDGCSVVQNHADLISPWIAAICHDLQSAFPYVFAQTYLTPPFSQTLNPHADDRDVIVIQLLGQKEWSVYQDVPIPFPYPHEQVGKRNDLPVPPHVLNGPTSISKTLKPGDVLYIPRGHVHQAFSSDDLSCHITIAIATFDWTLGAAIHRMTQAILMQDMESRKSMLPIHNREKIQEQLDRAMKLLQEEMTVDLLEGNVMARTQQHVQLDDPLRLNLLRETTAFGIPIAENTEIVGPEAAKRVTWNTMLRGATAEEKESVNLAGQVGMYIRDDAKADILAAAARFKDSSIARSVSQIRSLDSNLETNPYVCDLTLLSFAKLAVSLGALAIAE
jgi:ribosomal protein L16 Arg81 hydroxylase